MTNLRPIEVEDSDGIKALFLEKNSKLKWDFSKFLNHPDCFAVVAMKNRNIVGFGALIRYHTPLHGIIGRLEDIFVHPDYRGKSHGENIVKELMRLGQKLKLEQIVLTSNPKRQIARHIYLSLGFNLYETGLFVKNF